MDTQKADSIAFHFYTKLVHVVNSARQTAETENAKTDKWFNLETPDAGNLFNRQQRDVYRSVSSAPVPPLTVQVLLSVPTQANTVLVYASPASPRRRIEPTPSHILLESFTLSYDGANATQDDIPLPTIYKHGIPLFRSLYTLLRILPTSKLFKRIRRSRTNGFSIHLRVAPTNTTDTLTFPDSPSPISTQTFSSVPLPRGALTLSITYLTQPTFELAELESLLSSRFLSQDEPPNEEDFVPTLAVRSQRESSFSSSLPIRTALPRSPPSRSSPPSIVDKFIIPRTPSNVSSPGSASRINTSPQQVVTSSSLQRQQPFQLPSTSRLRTTSTGSSSTTSVTSNVEPSGQAVPIRRPAITPVHPFPFKSSTLSSSPSTHPLPTLLGSHRSSSSPLANPMSHPRAPSRGGSPTRGITSSVSRGGSPSSSSLPRGASPLTSASPFPTMTSSPLGGGADRRSLPPSEGSESTSSIPAAPGGRKRYSSSFGHRYNTSTGSTAATAAAATITSPNVDFPASEANDDEDISVFVQDIDRRQPLRTRTGSLPYYPQSYSTPPKASHNARSSPLSRSPAGAGRIINLPSVDDDQEEERESEVLRTESAVDERLRKMKEMFEASLVGLGSQGSASTARGRGLLNSGVSGSGESSEPGSQEVIGRMDLEGLRWQGHDRRTPGGESK